MKTCIHSFIFYVLGKAKQTIKKEELYMQLATHELRDLSKLIAGCYNTINTMSTYIQQA